MIVFSLENSINAPTLMPSNEEPYILELMIISNIANLLT